MHEKISRKRRRVIVVLFALILAGITEALSYATIYVANGFLEEKIQRTSVIYAEQSERIRALLRNRNTSFGMVDSVLGWRYRPGFESATDKLNGMGLRSSRDYAQLPGPGTLRVAAFGDSFVYGTEVTNDETWAAVAERFDERLEVLNYGVGGYGTDQALLRFRAEGMALSPELVLIGFAPIDLRRTVNVYRRFLSNNEALLTKPRFTLAPGGDLRLLDTPIRRPEDWEPMLDKPSLVIHWGENDHWYRPLVYENPLYDLSAAVRLLSALWIRVDNRYFDSNRIFAGGSFNPESAAFAIQVAVFEAFAAEVRAAGAWPLILILPNREAMNEIRTGRELHYEILLRRLDVLDLSYVDALDAFDLEHAESIDDWFAPGGHYSPDGNRIIAEWLAGRLIDGDGRAQPSERDTSRVSR